MKEINRSPEFLGNQILRINEITYDREKNVEIKFDLIFDNMKLIFEKE